MSKHHNNNCSQDEVVMFNQSTRDDFKPYFGSYPFDLEERINDFLDSQPRVSSSKEKI